RSILYFALIRLLIAFPFKWLQTVAHTTVQGNAPSSADLFHRLTETAAHVLQPVSRDTSKKEPGQSDPELRRD
ncbi:MAG: hypothetical protein KDJ67_11745, partial [Nitratireductor sp.]|nr:hypothetical protein [Nitratireductor sp.]